MASHVIDSVLYGPSFAPDDYRSVYSDENRVRKWFAVEVALAEAQGELGMIPQAAAREIRAKARVEDVDLAAIGAGIAETAHPLVPALRALEQLCEDGAGEFIHWGATTQDIMDTGAILQAREAWRLLRADLSRVTANLASQAESHKATVMVGRTHGQHALPITFGYKLAVWIDELGRHRRRMDEAETRIFVGNITGAVGSMASFGSQGIEMQARALAKLELGVPAICWHSARDRIVELASLMLQVSATLGKMAREIYSLQKPEIGELREPFHMGKVGSSTMPHKQNPSSVELSFALSRLVRSQFLALTDAAIHEHERDAGLLRIELAALPEMMIYSGALARRMAAVTAGMEVRPERMRENADLLGGLLLSERVMLVLGETIGKQTAHEVVYEVAMRAQEEGIGFRRALCEDTRVSEHLDAAEIDRLLDPADYVGLSAKLVEGVLAAL